MNQFSLIEALKNKTETQELINQIEKGNASIQEVDENKFSILVYALEWGLDDFAEYLIDKGAKLDAGTLHVAASTWNAKAVKKHLDAGLSADLVYSGFYPLNSAVSNLVKYKDPKKYPELEEVIDVLIEGKADINQKHEETGYTALQFAAHYGARDILVKLLLNRADVSATDKRGYNSLHHAVNAGYNFDDSIIRILTGVGLDINSQDEIYGQTALHIAVLCYRFGMVQILRNLEIDESIGLFKEMPFRNARPFYDVVFPIGTRPYDMAKQLQMTKLSNYLISDDDRKVSYASLVTIRAIHQLIQTGKKKKIASAFRIIREYNLDEEAIMNKWSALLEFVKLDDFTHDADFFTKGTNEEILHRLVNVETLFLASKGIRKLPKDIGFLRKLKWLELKNNPIKTLPRSIGQLSKLKGLYMNHNHLTKLPANIGELKSLKELYLYENELEALPESIASLDKLKELRLEKNKLSALPDNFGELKKLKWLWLDENPLTDLPDSFTQLKKLERLNLLNSLLSKEKKEDLKKQFSNCNVFF